MKKPKNNNLVILNVRGKLVPMQAISLLDIMRELYVGNIYTWAGHIERFLIETEKPRGALLSKGTIDDIFEFLNKLVGKQCENLGWIYANERIEDLAALLSQKRRPTAESVNWALREFRSAVENELSDRVFIEIAGSRVNLLKPKGYLKNSLVKAFPVASKEIINAAECLAVDLDTAAVFHSMRAAEYGMRALAVKLGVKLTYKGRPVPIEHGEWGQIITQIENKIQAKKMGRNEFEFLKFCRIMADELYKFKEYDRNDTMHCIRSYNASEARGVFDRVLEFMQRLSEKVSEK